MHIVLFQSVPNQNPAPSNNTKDAKQTVTRDQPLKSLANNRQPHIPFNLTMSNSRRSPAQRPKSAAQCVRENFIARCPHHAGNFNDKQNGPAYQGYRDLPASRVGGDLCGAAEKCAFSPFRSSAMEGLAQNSLHRSDRTQGNPRIEANEN